MSTKQIKSAKPFITLGWVAIDWIEHYLVHGPGDIQGELIALDDELCAFILKAYELDSAGKRKINRGFFSRAKGRAKSELAGMIVCFEFLGPSRFSHFDKNGNPVGKKIKYPFIRCLATEETQAGNTYDNVRFMLEHVKEKFPSEFPGLDVGLTRVLLSQGGEIVPSTASSASKDGGKETFAVADETHLYTSPELHRMHATIKRNLGKRKLADPWLMETSTMYAVGEDSVAEQTHRTWLAIKEGRLKNHGLLFDHVQAPDVVNIHDTKTLKKALAVAYGPAAAWLDLDRIAAEIQDPMTKASDAKRYFLNQPSTDDGKYMDPIAWSAAKRIDDPLQDGETISLGFDGSRTDDSTFLVATRLRDKRLFPIAAWEKPPGLDGDGWSVPRIEVDEVVRATFADFTVTLMYCDPSGWQSYIDAWSTDFPDQIVEIFPTSQRKMMAEAIDRFKEDIVEGLVTHNGSPILTRHVLNAQNAQNGQIKKPRQSDKIDGCVAAILSLEAAANSQDTKYDVMESFY